MQSGSVQSQTLSPRLIGYFGCICIMFRWCWFCLMSSYKRELFHSTFPSCTIQSRSNRNVVQVLHALKFVFEDYYNWSPNMRTYALRRMLKIYRYIDSVYPFYLQCYVIFRFIFHSCCRPMRAYSRIAWLLNWTDFIGKIDKSVKAPGYSQIKWHDAKMCHIIKTGFARDVIGLETETLVQMGRDETRRSQKLWRITQDQPIEKKWI